MCGVAGIFGHNWKQDQLHVMMTSQRHRGPDGHGIYIDPQLIAVLGHNRLKIIDLSEAGRQPMADPSGRYHIIFNGEIYNYLELRRELQSTYCFRSRTDTEVLLAAYVKWGQGCLDRLIGMFAFAIWDERTKGVFIARDRFGVKPLYYHQDLAGSLIIASEIKALHAAGVPAHPDEATWATYLAFGLLDHGERTFWKGIRALPPGHSLSWQDGRLSVSRWYDLAERARGIDNRSIAEAQEDYLSLLKESLSLRFRSDVPVGINLSGGLDSSALLGLVQAVQGEDSDVKAFTFCTGDARYDELPWVWQMIDRTNHRLVPCQLKADEVPGLAESVQSFQDEPFGGLPTLAYARLFEVARAEGVIVLLDGQGMDEQWAGYDYYIANDVGASIIQGTRDGPTRPDCSTSDFRALAVPFTPLGPFPDSLRNLQYRDAGFTKIPRALRFNDRVSMRASTELREPFLDHRLFEFALSQPAERKIFDGQSKWLLRQIVRKLLPKGIVESPKRPLQTPQREWLRGPLREWASGQIEETLAAFGNSWLDRHAVRATWQKYCDGNGDNSFYVWQWISIGLMLKRESGNVGPYNPSMNHTFAFAPFLAS